jgi:hypothetical protein
VFQPSPTLDEQCQIDGFVRHPHLRIIRVSVFEPSGDLLWRPPQPQLLLHRPAQPGVGGQLARFGTSRPIPRRHIGTVSPIPTPAAVTGHLPAHRRSRPAQPDRDRPQRLAGGHATRDLLPFHQSQMPHRTDPVSRPNSAVVLHHGPHRPMSPTQLTGPPPASPPRRYDDPKSGSSQPH